jgi:iron complex transport system substrate-binding protein
MRKQLLGGVFIALLFLVGCRQPTTFGGQPRKKFYKAVISLSPSTTEMVAFAGVRLIGRTKADDYPGQVATVEVVADLKPNYERIAQLKPDLIILDRDLYGDAEVAKLKQTGADVKIIGSDSVEGYIKDFYTLGNWVGGENNINEYLIKVQKQVAVSLGDKPSKNVKAAMIIPDASGHHMIAGAKSFQADVMRIIGSTPIGPDTNKFESLNPEYLLSQNPDVIFVAGDKKSLLADSRFANLTAVKTNSIVALNQDVALRRGQRVDTFMYDAHKAFLLLMEGKK